jgi:hypothetical protein
LVLFVSADATRPRMRRLELGSGQARSSGSLERGGGSPPSERTWQRVLAAAGSEVGGLAAIPSAVVSDLEALEI